MVGGRYIGHKEVRHNCVRYISVCNGGGIWGGGGGEGRYHYS